MILKEFLLKSTSFAIILLITILLIFFFASLKMSNVYLESKVDELETKVKTFSLELEELSDSYNGLIVKNIRENKVSFEEISLLLPEKEVRKIKEKIRK
jgi:uncharacterized membrane protein (DUF106 family)